MSEDLDKSSNLLVAWEPGPSVHAQPTAAPSARFRVESPMNPTQTFADEKRARLWATLSAALDGFRVEEVGTRGVPFEVADAGRPELATYLYADWGDSTRHIARRMEVDRETVWTYFNRVRRKAPEPDHE